MLGWLRRIACGSAKTDELERQNELADKLLETLGGIEWTLHKITQAFEELPSDDDLAPFAEKAGAIDAALSGAQSAWEELPAEDDLDPLTRKAAELSGALSAASEACEALPG